MPPQHGDASDGRSSYDSRFKSKQISLEDILQGATPPLSWLQQLGPTYKCNKLLDAGGLGSLLSMAKKYPRAVCLVSDRPYLLCVKLEDMDLCSYKWLKKLVDVVRVTRLPPQSFSRTVDIALEFNETDPDTGNNLEELLSFKEADASRFLQELEDARKQARKLQLEMAAAKSQGGGSSSSSVASGVSAPMRAPAPQAPAPDKYSTLEAAKPTPSPALQALTEKYAPAPAAMPAPASAVVAAPQFDADFGDFSAAPAPAAPTAPAPVVAQSLSTANPFDDEETHKSILKHTEAPVSAAAPASDPFGDFSAAPPMPASSVTEPEINVPTVAAVHAETPPPAAGESYDPFADLSDVKTALPTTSQAQSNLLD